MYLLLVYVWSPIDWSVESALYPGPGIASMTVPVYIAESSPPHLRGQLVTINTLFVTGGQFIASIVDGAFSYLQRDGWRYEPPACVCASLPTQEMP